MPTLTELYGLDEPAPSAGPQPSDDGDFIRGGKEAFQQLPQMGYGLIAGAGAIGEKVFGEGGIATGVKQAGLKGYTEWADKMAAQSKPSDSWSYSYAKAKDGDFGALVDWLQHGIGYAGAQGIQMLATAGIGAAGGKLLIGTAADKLASGMVAKEAARLAAENATVEATKRIAADQIRSFAVKNVASKLGQLGAVGALATGQEGGEIFGGLVQKAEEEGTQLSGGDLARAFGATLAAGGLEFVGDKLGLDVLLGRSKLVNPAKAMTGLGGRAARGVLAGAAVAPAEAATEYFQTGIEEYGKGTETNPLPWLQSPENQAQAFDAAALGGLGAAMVGGAGGAIHGAQTGKREEPVANIEDIATAPSIDEAIIAADKAVSGEPTRGERVANIKSELSDRAIVGDLRTKYGDDGFSQLLTSLNQANNPRTPEATREKHLQAVETALFNLRVSVDRPAQTALLEGQQAMPMLTGPDGVAVPETAADLTETMRARDERTSLGEQQGQMPDDVIPMGMRQEQPAWTNPRSKAPEPTIIDALNVPNAVNAYVDRQRAINTPMAHAFVQAFDSGRITPADVAKLIVPSQQETPNDRIAAAAATAPQTLQQRLEAFRRAPDATTIETPVVASRPRPKGAPDAIGGTGTVQDMAQGQPEQAGQPAAAPAPGSADALPVGVQSEPDAALSLRERADAMRAKNAPAVASAEQPAVAPEKPRVFKTRKNAIVERDRLGNEHKLQKIKGGYILRRKTDKEMAAEAKAGRRFASGAASGLRRSLLATIAAGGGLNISERHDTIGEGNRNVGGRMVFTRAGKTINQWAETLAQSGFIPPREVESDDGVRWLQDAIGEEFAGRREHFAMDDEARMDEAARAAQGEEPAPDDGAFGPLADFDLEELSADGYASASPEVQALTEQVLAAADEAGLDIEALREDAARLTEGLSDDEYHAQLQASARAAIAQTRTDAARSDAGADQASQRDRGETADAQGDEGTASEGLTLEAQDAQSLREKTEREAAAKAAEAKQKADEQRRLEREALDRETRDRARQDASADNFVLGQDANDALAGQGSIFDAPQSDAAAQVDAQPAPKTETAKNAEKRHADARAIGEQAAKDGAARSAPVAFTRAERAAWLAGYDDAGEVGAAAPAKPEKSDKAVANEPQATYGVANEGAQADNAPYETDLFGQPLPAASRANRRAAADRAGLRGNVQSEPGVPADTPATPGDYYAPTVVGVVTQRKLGAARINSPQEAAQATSYLYESAVERFDGIVTDKDGKPLAVVGGFKGALSQTSVYPATLMGEAVRVPGAARIWFSHNHPSGSAYLSRSDEHLNAILTDVFDGSGIEPMGLLAIGGDEYGYAQGSDFAQSPEPIPPSRTSATVPVIERKATKPAQKRPDITAPAAAKAAANAYYAASNGPGLMLLDVQHGISAWVPMPPQMMGRLRATGGLNAIYRAVSESNAGAAVIVHGGELDGMVAGSITAAQNIAAALQKLDVRVLDIIDAKTGESAAERGRTIGEGPVYSVAGAPGQTTREALRQRLADEFGADVIDALESAGLLRIADAPPSSMPSDVAGATEGERISLFAGNTPAGSTAVAYHEALHATLRRMIGDAAFEALMRRMPLLAAGNRKWFAEAADRIPADTPKSVRNSELASYAVEQYQRDREAMPAGVRKWVQDLIAAIKVGLGKALQAAGVGLKLRVRLLSDAGVLHKLARDGLRTMAREAGQDAQRGLAPAFSVAPKTDSAAFRKWFGDSKVVDAQGRPLVVYHGTTGDLTAFDLSFSGSDGVAYDRPAIFATDDASVASDYARNKRNRNIADAGRAFQRFKNQNPGVYDDEYERLFDAYKAIGRREGWDLGVGANVMPLYLSIQNPLEVDGRGERFMQVMPEAVKRASTQGRDGVIVRNVIDHASPASEYPVTVYIAFRPEQIKSAIGNSGAFDGANPDIRYSRAPSTDTAAFKKWFGASVVTENGRAGGVPLVVYHGTNRRDRNASSGDSSNSVLGVDAVLPRGSGDTAIASFDTSTQASGLAGSEEGFFFTDDTNAAGRYAKMRGSDGAYVLPVYLSIKNPLIADFDNTPNTTPPGLWRAKIFKEAQKNGYDGIIFKNMPDIGGESTQYVAFRPEQIKSATGNSGAFDPANPDIRYSRAAPQSPAGPAPTGLAAAAQRLRNAGGGTRIIGQTARQYTPEQIEAMRNVGFQVDTPTIEERIKSLWKDAGKKLAQGLVDQFAPVKDISAEAYGLLRLAKGASGAFETLLKGGKLKLTEGVYDFDDADKGGVVESLLIPLQGEHHDFLRWVAANRAERLVSEGKENLFSDDDIDNLKSLSDGTTDFDYTIQHGARAGQVTRDRTLIYEDSLKTFNGFNKNVLDMAEQSGLIDAESRKVWEHEFYVPFYRVADEDDGGVKGMNVRSGAVRQEAFKRLKGGRNELNADLLDNTLMNWAHLLDASAKNRAAKATLEAAEQMGAAISSTESAVRDMSAATQKKNGVVWVMDEGVKRFYLVGDPYLLQALVGLEYAGMRGPMMKAMGAFKHALTVGVTASPFFKIRNLIRDSVQAIGTGPISYNPAGNVAQGWALTDPKSDAYFRLLAGGGTIHFGTMMEGNEAKRVQALVESGVDRATILNDQHKLKAFYRKFIEPGVTAYNELGNRGEAINRASLYAQLRAQGVGHAEASLQARDLMDFSMQGSFTSIRFLTQVVPFLNARIQGLYKLGRAAKEDPARIGAVLGATTLASLSLLLAFGDDDDWKKREDWDRNNFWWFKFGGMAFRIPKPFEIGAIATLAERGFELAFDKEMTGTRFRGQVLKLLGDNLAMNPVPQLVKPMLDVYANVNSFTGRPIETMSMERLRPQYRFTDRTSMTARAASTAANAVTGLVGADGPSPVQIDHMLRGYFGWLGTFVVGTADVIARPATGQPSRPASDVWRTATGNMVSDLRDAPSRYVSQMYEQARVIEEAYGTWRALLKSGEGEEAREFFEDNRETILKRRLVERQKSALTEMNQRIRAIERSNDMTADEKRAAIRLIQSRKDMAARVTAMAR